MDSPTLVVNEQTVFLKDDLQKSLSLRPVVETTKP